MTNLKLWTSYVSPATMEALPNYNILPVFIIRNISNSSLIGKYSGTAIHQRIFAPSYELFKSYKYDKLISDEEFEKGYLIELSKLNIPKIMDKLFTMANTCWAKGIAFMGYGKFDEDYRSIFSDFMNRYGYDIKEISL